MKMLLAMLCLFPFTAFAQTKADYDQTFARFMKYYNSNQTDSICTLFPISTRAEEMCFWKMVNAESSSLEEYGSIKSFKYLGIDKTDAESVRVFKVDYSKAGTKAMSFTLEPSTAATVLNKTYVFGTFRFITSSDAIEAMLRQAKQKRKS
jgi:hypothetical protein